MNRVSSGAQVYRRLLAYVKPYRWAFALAIFGNILYGLVDAGFVKLFQPLINEGFVSKNQAFIAWIPFIVVGIFLVRGVATFLSTYCMGWVGRNVVKSLRQDMFAQLLKLPTSYYDKVSSGELLSKLTYNVEQVADASSDAFTVMVRESCTAVGLILVMLSVSWRLTLYFIVTVPIMALVMHFVSKRMRRISSKVQDSVGSVAHVAEEAIEGQKVIKAFGGQQYEKNQFNRATHHNLQQEMKMISTSAFSIPVIQLIGSFALAGVVYLATLGPESVLKTAITPGEFTAIIAAMIALLKPLKQLTKVNTNIQKGLAGASSIFSFLDETPEKDTGTIELSKATGHIEFKNVKFHYDIGQHKFNLSGMNFTVKPGETIAFVGRSGAGKSTLVNLLPRFYDIPEGDILIDGIKITDLTLASLRQSFAFVSQQVMLFNDTVANNIAYGLKDVSEEEIIEAAEMAYCMDFINELPKGLQSHIGENGVRLSGGQRQRLAIARAILKKAPILILDEATSALDSESERKIQQALTNLMGKCTTLVIAHRLSTIEKADRILVIDNGKIIESGTHQELLNQLGIYKQLRTLQYDGQPV
jgi:subfamily B ATP-binding cassette protein MsbA